MSEPEKIPIATTDTGIADKLNTCINHFPKRVKYYRELRGFSLNTLGIMSVTSKKYIDQLEKGERTPKIDTALRVATALRVSVSDLVGDYEFCCDKENITMQ